MDSETEGCIEIDINESPKKKKKYTQTYCKDWEGQLSWLSSSSKGIDYGFCKICRKDLVCGEGGLKDLKRHGETEAHKG